MKPILEQWTGVAVWTAVVTACAVPVAVQIRETVSPADAAGIAAGLIVWIATMTWVSASRRACGAPDGLVHAGIVYAALQGLLAAAAPAVAVLVLYMPAVWIAGTGVVRTVEAIPGVSAFVLTLACGGQVFASLLLLERVTRSLRERSQTLGQLDADTPGID